MKVTPLNETGQPVDWWFIYKVPKMEVGFGDAALGYEYIYFDPGLGKVIKSENLLTSGKGALDLTLNTLFQQTGSNLATTGWILYNDEMPADAGGKDADRFGHTKGVLAFDTKTETAFWLLHSWPKYADPKAQKMPTPDYGQTFLCVSLDIHTASQIAAQMANYQAPQVYLPRIPSSLDPSNALNQLTQQVNPDAAGGTVVLSLQSLGGLDFKVIAKNRKWDQDFWIDLVGDALEVDLDVETWVRGKMPPVQDSNGINKVVDVKYIDLHPLDIGASWTWPETKDHAKWGISLEKDWVCIADINRMISQEKRGGGAIAFQCKALWTALSKTDLIVPPAGYSKEDGIKLIQSAS